MTLSNKTHALTIEPRPNALQEYYRYYEADVRLKIPCLEANFTQVRFEKAAIEKLIHDLERLEQNQLPALVFEAVPPATFRLEMAKATTGEYVKLELKIQSNRCLMHESKRSVEVSFRIGTEQLPGLISEIKQY